MTAASEPLIRSAGPPFSTQHAAMLALRIDMEPLRRTTLTDAHRALALDAWGQRVQTEYASIQTITRFLAESLAAGDPLDVYAGAVSAIEDELRHTALCVQVVEALGGVPMLPSRLDDPPHPEFLSLPPAARALATAVSMLAISETISVALIEDLARRATHPTIAEVLAATLADEDSHRGYGWEYVRSSLARFDEGGKDLARMVARHTLEPHLDETRRVLAAIPTEARSLDHYAEPDLAALGLMGAERQALIIDATIASEVWPRLLELGIG